MAAMAGAERTNRYDIPLRHLEYDYIEDITDVKYLEKIVKTLRSGDEGRYPDLEEFAEKRLQSINPKSKVLWKAEHVSTPRDLDKSEWAEIAGDLDNWTSEMKSTDEELKARVSVEGDLPPVRGQSKIIHTEKLPTDSKKESKDRKSKGSSSSKMNKPVKPRGYREWDKFDIDAELAKVDVRAEDEEEDAEKTAEAVKSKTAENVLRKGSKPAIPERVDATGLSEHERCAKAISEKEKGNEAFRAKDFEEALLYYCRSLSLSPTIAAFNNRAQAYLKLKEWDKALADCQTVLEGEPGNLKGVLRRAVAYQGKGQYVNAKIDLKMVLSIDSGNKRAQDILTEVEKLLAEQKLNGRRMVIAESDGSDSASDSEQPVKPASFTKSDANSATSHVVADANINNTTDTLVNGVHEQTTNSQSETSETKSSSQSSKDIFEGEGDVKEDEAKVNFEQKTEDPSQLSKKAQESKPSGLSKNDAKPLVKNESGGNEHKVGKNSKRRKKGKGSARYQAHQQSVKNASQAKKMSEPSTTTAPSASPTTTAANPEAPNMIPVVLTDHPVVPVTSQVEPEDTQRPAAQEDQATLEQTPTPVTTVPLVESPPQPPPQKTLPDNVMKIKTKGNEQFKVGQYGDAIHHYDKGIDVLLKEKEGHDANLSVLYSNRAACKLKTGDCEGCVRDCNDALKLVPGSIKPLTRRAQAYEMMEKFRRAYIDFRQVLYVDSSVDVAMQGVNRCMKMLQQVDGPKWRENLPAVDMSSLTPISVPTAMVTTVTPVCTPASTPTDAPHSHPPQDIPSDTVPTETTPAKEGTPTKTEATPEPVLTKEESFEKHKSQGNAFVQKSDFTQAISCYTMCIEILPDRSVPYTNRALCHLKLNKPEDVIVDCSKALELEPDNIKALFRRAQAYKMLEKYDESFHDLTCLLKQDSKNMPARREFQVVINYREQAKKARLAAENEKKKPQPALGKQRQRMKIQEVSESEDEDDEPPKAKPTTSEDKSKQQKANKNKNQKRSKGAKDEAKPAKSQAKSESVPAKSETKSDKQDPKPAVLEEESSEHNAEAKSTTGNAESKNLSKTEKGSATTEKAKSPTKDDMPRLLKKTPYEFLQAWNGLRLTKHTEPYAKLLEQIEPEDIPKVISNKLDGDMLHMIIKSVELLLDQGTAHGSPLPSLFSRSLAYLQQLTNVPRFSMVTMFMGGKEKKDLQRVLNKLSAGSTCQYLQKDLKELTKAYNF